MLNTLIILYLGIVATYCSCSIKLTLLGEFVFKTNIGINGIIYLYFLIIYIIITKLYSVSPTYTHIMIGILYIYIIYFMQVFNRRLRPFQTTAVRQ